MMQIPVLQPVHPRGNWTTRAVVDGEILFYHSHNAPVLVCVKPNGHTIDLYRINSEYVAEYKTDSPRYGAQHRNDFSRTGYKLKGLTKVCHNQLDDHAKETQFTFRGVRIFAFKKNTHYIWVESTDSTFRSHVPDVARNRHDLFLYHSLLQPVCPWTTHNVYARALRLAADEAALREGRHPSERDYEDLPEIQDPYPLIAPIERIV